MTTSNSNIFNAIAFALFTIATVMEIYSHGITVMAFVSEGLALNSLAKLS